MKSIIAAASVGAFVLVIAAPALAMTRGNPTNPDMRKHFYSPRKAPTGDAMPASMKRKGKMH